ncbi:MAG: hypothetical protein WD689_01095 [Gaiellaceae bacterium]
MAAFAVAALVIVALLFAAASGVARAQQATVERIKAQAPAVKRWGGFVLLGVGAWFIVLAVFADAFADLFPV